MPLTMEQVRATLGPDEPDYEAASTLGPEALPHLSQLVLSGNPELAAKAASLAGRISADGSEEILGIAARSPNAVVRVAAAEGLARLPAELTGDVLVALVSDEDPGVRQVALESVGIDATPELRSRIAEVGEGDPMPHIRELARRTLERISGETQP